MNQPINLSSLLTILGAGRGHGTAQGHGDAQGHGRRALVQSDAPSGFSPNEVTEGHRDKRQRLNSPLTRTTLPKGNLTTRRSTASIPIWAPRLSHGNRPVSICDSAEFKDTALALSQALFLPGDMQREVDNTPDKLLSSFMVNSVKVCSLTFLFMSF